MDYLYFVAGTFAAIALLLLVICVILGKIPETFHFLFSVLDFFG